jgi:hypothetical protein
MKFLNDRAEHLQKSMQAQSTGQGVRVSTGQKPSEYQHGPGFKPIVSNMQEAIERSESEARKAGLKGAASVARAQQWLRDNHLLDLVNETRVLTPLARLLDRVADHDK